MWPIKSMPSVWPAEIVFLKKVFTSSNNVLLACGQNFYASMKYKALCRDYDIDISQMSVSCKYLRKYDKFQIVVHTSLCQAYGFLIVLAFCIYLCFMSVYLALYFAYLYLRGE